MFGKLKDKLKGALSAFSKKTEEEAEEKTVEVEAEATEELVKQTKEAFDEKGDLKKKKKKKPAAEKIVEEVKEKEKKEKKKKKEIAKKIEEKAAVKEAEEEPKEKGFFGSLKEKFFSKDAEEEKEEAKEEEEIKEAEEHLEKEVDFSIDSDEVVEEKQEEIVEEIKEEQQEIAEKIEEVEEKVEEVKEKILPEATKEPEKEEEPEEEKKGFFARVKQTLTTKTISADKFEELFWDLEVVLLENNVSVAVIEKIKEDLKEELVDKPLPRDVPAKIEETLRKTLTEILTYNKIDLLSTEKKPYVIAFFGINGAGKTTSVAKIAHHFKKNGKSVVLAACDTFRAAAIHQLEEHATKLDVKIIKHDYGSDAAAVAYDAIKYAEKNEIDVVLIDTAGRLHSNTNLMAELEKVIRVANPDLKLFVGESITGNDCIEQAEKFNELVEMDGAILTKADVDEKGGAPLSISYVIKKPILFLGVGQEYDDLEEFDVPTILGRLGF